jgi:hypothetical protein
MFGVTTEKVDGMKTPPQFRSASLRPPVFSKKNILPDCTEGGLRQKSETAEPPRSMKVTFRSDILHNGAITPQTSPNLYSVTVLRQYSE